MKPLLSFILLVSCFIPILGYTQGHANKNIQTFTIGVAHYPPYVDENIVGLGMYPKYLKTFFDSKKIKVDFKILPFARTLYALECNKVDMTILSKRHFPKATSRVAITEAFY